jgi:hypothetical protein
MLQSQESTTVVSSQERTAILKALDEATAPLVMWKLAEKSKIGQASIKQLRMEMILPVLVREGIVKRIDAADAVRYSSVRVAARSENRGKQNSESPPVGRAEDEDRDAEYRLRPKQDAQTSAGGSSTNNSVSGSHSTPRPILSDVPGDAVVDTRATEQQLKCRRCKTPLTEEAAIFYSASTQPASRPVCQTCYENMMKCRRCKAPLTAKTAIFYTPTNLRSTRPVCQTCYEDMVSEAVRLNQRHDHSASSVDREYHGDNYFG